MGHDPALLCVPNFSEGRNAQIIERLVSAAASSARVLDVHSDEDHNRTVVSIVGAPPAVVEAVARCAAVAVDLIDISAHLGEHPRIGAIDVVPMVALDESTLHVAAKAALAAAERLCADLSLPVFLYDPAMDGPTLPEVRRRAFKSLRPHCAGTEPHATAGAAAVGARTPLVAFNVNLDTKQIAVAKRIAHSLREVEGGLAGVRALGFALRSRGIVQVSMNLTQPDLVSMNTAFRAVSELARAEGVTVVGSELVGLTPRIALTDAAELKLASPPKIIEEELERTNAAHES